MPSRPILAAVFLALVVALAYVLEAPAQSPRPKAARPGSPTPPSVGRGTAAPNRPMRVGPGATKSGRRNPADINAATETEGDAAEAKDLGEYVRFPTVGVKLRQPKGFEKDKTFDGFGQRETSSSVMIVVLKGPFREITAGFTADKLRTRGWKFLSKEDARFGEQTGVLIHFEQPAAGTTFVKWTAAFGTDEQTTLITATFPKDEAANLSAMLKSCVLSVLPDDGPPADPDAEIPFTIASTEKLKRTQGISRIIAFTEVGKVPAASPKEALFFAAPSLGAPALAPTKATAERRFRQTEHIKNLKIASTKEVQVGDLTAFESRATANDEKSDTPLAIYQLMIFTTDGYILVQGLVGVETQAEFMPEFERLAHSIKLKPAATDK